MRGILKTDRCVFHVGPLSGKAPDLSFSTVKIWPHWEEAQ